MVVLVLVLLEMVEPAAAEVVQVAVVQMVDQEIHLVYHQVKVIVEEMLLVIQQAVVVEAAQVPAAPRLLMLMVLMEVMVLHHHTQVLQ